MISKQGKDVLHFYVIRRSLLKLQALHGWFLVSRFLNIEETWYYSKSKVHFKYRAVD